MRVANIKTNQMVKTLSWLAALAAVTIGIIWCFWLTLLYMIFEDPFMYISIAGGILFFYIYWQIIRLAK